MTDGTGELVDQEAAVLLYQRCYEELGRYLTRLIGDRSMAEDLTQDAGMRLIEAARREALRLKSPRAFLFHIATNLARDHLRRAIRTDAVMRREQGEVAHASPADQVAVARQEVSMLSAEVAKLPPRPRQALMLSRVEGLSHAEIGVRLGIAPKTVENHIGRALTQLTRHLGRRQ
jgi:RNA polymerase sigma factor (sigma-70 family)